MKEIIKSINVDLNKCNDAINTNSLMEIAIAIEEMIDKYRYEIKDLTELEKRNVWSYNKKDLEKVIDYIKGYEVKLRNQYNQTIINESFHNSIENIESSNNLSCERKKELIDIINKIKNISNEDCNKDVKWSKLRDYINFISNESFEVGFEILNLLYKICTYSL
ncbi:MULTISPECIES: hypothetical protein [unclassified Romboutsia]|uniref:hypothetical protein n=1 Tax=unclassified Romboutsia TaxID=2626894 RepID=UPI0008212C4D|nr:MULTISPECIES: hypothetical protein [unclassified Romboutsia]SCI11690.1 Uncharacterised protein [uncultured Clostridium sp.]